MNCKHCGKPLATVLLPPDAPICRCDGPARDLEREAWERVADDIERDLEQMTKEMNA